MQGAVNDGEGGCRSSGSEEEAYTVSLGEQGPWESDLVRLGYSSLVTPTSTYDVNVRTGKHAHRNEWQLSACQGSAP